MTARGLPQSRRICRRQAEATHVWSYSIDLSGIVIGPYSRSKSSLPVENSPVLRHLLFYKQSLESRIQNGGRGAKTE